MQFLRYETNTYEEAYVVEYTDQELWFALKNEINTYMVNPISLSFIQFRALLEHNGDDISMFSRKHKFYSSEYSNEIYIATLEQFINDFLTKFVNENEDQPLVKMHRKKFVKNTQNRTIPENNREEFLEHVKCLEKDIENDKIKYREKRPGYFEKQTKPSNPIDLNDHNNENDELDGGLPLYDPEEVAW